MYVVVGLHTIKPEHVDQYVEHVKTHAENSRQESGCARYEVLRSDDDPCVFALIEVFQDEAAFREHLVSDHYRWWMELSAGWRLSESQVRHVMDFISQSSSSAS